MGILRLAPLNLFFQALYIQQLVLVSIVAIQIAMFTSTLKIGTVQVGIQATKETLGKISDILAVN